MIELNLSKQFSEKEKQKLQEALILTNQALGNAWFKDLWLAKTCTYNQGMTQAQILTKLQENRVIFVSKYTPFWPFSKAISSEVNGGIRYNSRKLPSLSVKDIACNILHEFSHAFGFMHPGNYKNAQTMATVPYMLGATLEEWLKEKG